MVENREPVLKPGAGDNLASGVIRHAVLKIANGDEGDLSGILQPKKMLSLFDWRYSV